MKVGQMKDLEHILGRSWVHILVDFEQVSMEF